MNDPYFTAGDFLRDSKNLPISDEDRVMIFRSMELIDRTTEEIKGGVMPDTYGADSIFVSFFVNHEMIEDFPWILLDFYRHEAGSIGSFSRVDYLGKEYSELDGFIRISDEGINLIFNAFRDGNEYAKATLQNLYKTYYKAEYRSFKRYDEIDIQGIDDLCDGDGFGRFDDVAAARILTMCQIFDKKIHPSAMYTFPLLTSRSGHLREYINDKAKGAELKKNRNAKDDQEQAFIDYVHTKDGERLRDA